MEPRVDDLAASVRAAEDALGDRRAAWTAVLDVVGRSCGLVVPPVRPDLADLLVGWTAPGAADLLSAVHESTVEGRAASGTFYTPPALVAWVLDHALDPLLPEGAGSGPVPRVLDPACGSGAFLVAVVRRVVERLGVPASAVVPRVHGTDLDPVAVAITTLLLRLEAPDVDPRALRVRVADGLGDHPGAPFDVVLGNPPFHGRLRRAAASPGPLGSLGSPGSRPPGPYTDTSAVFLARALDLAVPGGVVAMVQPLSLLAARDAAPVRGAVVGAGAVTAFWSSLDPVFPGTTVRTCAVVVRRGAGPGPVVTWCGPAFDRGPDLALPAGEWGALAAGAAGIPAVDLDGGSGTLGDLGPCTADFRDQYYGLVPFVGEGDPDADPDPDADDGGRGDTAPLVTSGLIEPAASLWGLAPTRFAKTRLEAPTVDLVALRAEGSLTRWAAARLVPKVLVATQGRVVEAVVDVEGAWLPSVPVITLVPRPDRLWHALAVLLAPPVVAQAAARYLGTGLSGSAIKLSASQVAALPLPVDLEAWDDGARLARLAQTGPPSLRPRRLRDCAVAMCAAYDDHTALAWWVGRARLGDDDVEK